MTSIMSSDFLFACTCMKAFIQNLVQIGTVVSEKIQFELLYEHDLGPEGVSLKIGQGQSRVII